MQNGVSETKGWVWYLPNLMMQYVAVCNISEVIASCGVSAKPHLLQEECLGKVATVVGAFPSQRVQSLTLKYCTYKIYIQCVFICSQLLSFAEMAVADDNDFKKSGELLSDEEMFSTMKIEYH